MAQICSQISFLVSRIEMLDMRLGGPTSQLELILQIDMDNTQWLELLHSFPVVHTLHISRELQSPIVLALQGLSGESATEVFARAGQSLPSGVSSIWIGTARRSSYSGALERLRRHCIGMHR
jgi:hypothetical protein